MELELDLEYESKEKLEKRWRNAKTVWLREPGSALGQKAAGVMELIEQERERRSIPGAISAFLETFPHGFDDALYRKQERDDKVEASQLARSLLSIASFDGQENDELVAAVKTVINKTNLIQGSFEKPKFLDALQDPQNTPTFLAQIRRLLHGDADASSRLASFSDYLHTLGLRKWTYGTYLLFLMEPESNLFVKPESLKKAADRAVFDLGYDPAPTAAGYVRILEFGRWIEARLRNSGRPELAPKDLIDIQSFIWFMAPTGKFAK